VSQNEAKNLAYQQQQAKNPVADIRCNACWGTIRWDTTNGACSFCPFCGVSVGHGHRDLMASLEEQLGAAADNRANTLVQFVCGGRDEAAIFAARAALRGMGDDALLYAAKIIHWHWRCLPAFPTFKDYERFAQDASMFADEIFSAHNPRGVKKDQDQQAER